MPLIRPIALTLIIAAIATAEPEAVFATTFDPDTTEQLDGSDTRAKDIVGTDRTTGFSWTDDLEADGRTFHFNYVDHSVNGGPDMLGARLATDPENPDNAVLRTWQKDSLWQTGGWWSRVQGEWRHCDFEEFYHRIHVRIGSEAAVVNHTDWGIWTMMPLELRPSVDPNDHSLSVRMRKGVDEDVLTWSVHRRVPGEHRRTWSFRTGVPVEFDRWIQLDFYAKAGPDSETGRLFLAVDRRILIDERVPTAKGGGTWENLGLFKVYGDLIDNATDPERGAQDQVQVWFDDAAVYDSFAAAEAPIIEPAGGTFTAAQEVVLSSATDAARIHYTLDGSVPDTGSASVANGDVLTLTADADLRAVAIAEGKLESAITSAEFIFPPPQRAIEVESVPGVDWECSPSGTRNETEDVIRFEDLDGARDHRLEAKGSGNS